MDKYFKTTKDKAAVTKALGLTAADGNAANGVSIEAGGTLFRNDKFTLLWAGRLVETYNPKTNKITYKENGANFFTVRFSDDSTVSGFDGFKETEIKGIVFA